MKMAARICSITSAWPTIDAAELVEHRGAVGGELVQVFGELVGGGHRRPSILCSISATNRQFTEMTRLVLRP